MGARVGSYMSLRGAVVRSGVSVLSHFSGRVLR